MAPRSSSTNRTSRFSPATVIASLALFVALGGTVYAATAERNSVVSKSIRDGAIKGKDVRPDTLKGVQIDEGSLSLPAQTASGPAGGDLGGNYPNPSITANAVNGGKVADNSLGGADINEASLALAPNSVGVDQIVTGAVGSDEVVNNSLDGSDVNEVNLAIPTAWAQINDADGAAANPTVVDGEGIISVNDGTLGPGVDGLTCFDLVASPTGSNYDLVTVTDKLTGSIRAIGSGAVPATGSLGCTGANTDAETLMVEATTGTATGEDIYVAFYDL